MIAITLLSLKFMANKKQAALGFIFITLLIDVTGFGIIIPIIPTLIQELANCSLNAAAVYGGWLQTTYDFMQFVCAPILGNLSDQFGRRPVLLFSLFGYLLVELLQVLLVQVFLQLVLTLVMLVHPKRKPKILE